MTVEALKGIEGVTPRESERSKNFFALGLMTWLYGRPTENTLEFIAAKFAKRPEIAEANRRAFNAGYNYGETSEDFLVQYEVLPAPLGALPADHRQPGTRVRPDRRVAEVEAAALPRRVPDHASIGDSRGAREPQELRRADVPGRGRDRRRWRRARRELRRRARRLHLRRPGVVLKAETVGLGVTLELPLGSSTSSAPARRPGCRRSRSRRTC